MARGLHSTDPNMGAIFTPRRNLPARKGSRPRTMLGPLHIQYNEHGDRKYLERLADQVLNWPHVEAAQPQFDRPTTIFIRLQESATASEAAAFITDREFGRILLAAPTIYLALPTICAHWAIVRRWAEPHYLTSYGLMPAGTVVVYTPRDETELEVCAFLFQESYRFACKSPDRSAVRTSNGQRRNAIFASQTGRPEVFRDSSAEYSSLFC
jgi:hypothetical protein